MQSKPSQSSPKRLLIGALLCAVALEGCTSTTSVAMMPSDVDIVATHPQSLSVEATGTPRRWGVGTPFVPSEVLQSTVEEAVLDCELFGAIAKRGDYHLTVELTELDKPESGLDMTAGVTMRWVLVESRTNTTVWISTVTTAFTASTTHSSQLDDRLRLSIEGALRENIELGLHKLSEVNLPGSIAVD